MTHQHFKHTMFTVVQTCPSSSFPCRLSERSSLCTHASVQVGNLSYAYFSLFLLFPRHRTKVSEPGLPKPSMGFSDKKGRSLSNFSDCFPQSPCVFPAAEMPLVICAVVGTSLGHGLWALGHHHVRSERSFRAQPGCRSITRREDVRSQCFLLWSSLFLLNVVSQKVWNFHWLIYTYDLFKNRGRGGVGCGRRLEKEGWILLTELYYFA